MRPTAEAPAVHDCWNRIGVRGDRSCGELKPHVHCRNCPTYMAAAAVLLDRELPEDCAHERTSHFAAAPQVQDPDTESAVIFRIGGEWLALPTAVFQEVASLRAIHSLPHRRGGLVRGLANVRGELLVCVWLEHLLGLEPAAAQPAPPRAAAPRLLIVQRETRRAALAVSEVHGIQRYHPRQLTPPPATVAKARSPYTRAILPWREHAVGLLDDSLLFHTLNRSLSSATVT